MSRSMKAVCHNDGPGLVAGTLSAHSDGGPRGRAVASWRRQSQQLNKSIDVVVTRPPTILVRHPHLQLHSDALPQPSLVDVFYKNIVYISASNAKKYYRTTKQLLSLVETRHFRYWSCSNVGNEDTNNVRINSLKYLHYDCQSVTINWNIPRKAT